MILLPLQISETDYSVFVVLEEENMARLREYDPAEVTLSKLERKWQHLRLRDVVISYATADEVKELMAALFRGDSPNAALKPLIRGWKFQPESGDHDAPYLSVRTKKGGTKH